MLPPKEFSNFGVSYWIPSIFLEVKYTPCIHFETTHPTTRWYSRVGGFFLISFMFTPKIGEIIQFDDCAYFSDGLKLNHQLDYHGKRSFPRFFSKGSEVLHQLLEGGRCNKTGAPFEGETNTKVLGFLLGGSSQLVSG